MTASRYRGSIAVWTALLAYASLYPFYPLRFPSPQSVSALFLVPRHFIRADIAFNIVAYIPLGVLTAVYFRARGDRHPLLLALAFGTAFSFAMETAQLFIPNRVATVVDVAANALGSLIGIVAFAEPLNSLVTGRLAVLREDLVLPGAWGDAALVLLMLWFLAQLNPALPFFGAGDIVSYGEGDLRVLLWTAVSMSICGFGLFVSVVMRPEHGALRMTVVILSMALWLKFAFASLMLQPNFSADWVSTGRMLGLAGGMLAFIPLRRVGRVGRTYFALILILAGALFAKIFGAYSPLEELLRLFRWPHGQLASFATLTRFLHELWPLAAVVFLASLFIHSRRTPVP
ncbi:MAG: VanZ family protein [Usitatibacter sp.]